MKLENKTKNKTVITQLCKTRNMWDRMKGLLGTKTLNSDSGLWIIPCNNVHTCFMNYAIDLVFVDAELKVKTVFQNVSPFRLLWPVWSARSVFELPAGTVEKNVIEVGDQLHVGH